MNQERLYRLYGPNPSSHPSSRIIHQMVACAKGQLGKISPWDHLELYPPSEEDIITKGDPQPSCPKGLITKIWSIFKEVEEWPNFPNYCCDQVSEKLARATGLLVCTGYFQLDRPIGHYSSRRPSLKESHTWNVDPKRGLIIDLTSHQFNAGLDYPLPPKPLIFPFESFSAIRYQPNAYYPAAVIKY